MKDLKSIKAALENAREKLQIECGGTREYKGGLATQFLFPQIDEALTSLKTFTDRMESEKLVEEIAGALVNFITSGDRYTEITGEESTFLTDFGRFKPKDMAKAAIKIIAGEG